MLSNKDRGAEGLGHDKISPKFSSTPPQLVATSCHPASGLANCRWQFSPPTLGVGDSSPQDIPIKNPTTRVGVFIGGR